MMITMDTICRELFIVMTSFSDGLSTYSTDTSICVRYSLSLWMFMLCVILLTKRIMEANITFESTLLLIGSTFGVANNFFMLIFDYGTRRNLIPYHNLLAEVPILDNVFQILMLLSINYAILVISKCPKKYYSNYHFSYILPFILYLVMLLFGTGKYGIHIDYMFMLVTTTLIISVLYFAIREYRNVKISLIGFLLFMLVSQLYGITNYLTGGEYSDILVPYHNAYELWSAQFILYYIIQLTCSTKEFSHRDTDEVL